MEWTQPTKVFQEVVEGGLSAWLDVFWRREIGPDPIVSITVYDKLDRNGLKQVVEIAEQHDLAVAVDDDGRVHLHFAKPS